MKKIKNIALLLWLVPSLATHAHGASSVEEEAPAEVQEACIKYGKEYGIKPELLEAVCWKESRYQEGITDKSRTCFGLMQIKASCHRDRMKRLGVIDLYDIDSNVHVGADILADLFDEYEDAGTVLMIYHGEKGAVGKAKRGKISSYASDILELSDELEKAHKKERNDDYIRRISFR